MHRCLTFTIVAGSFLAIAAFAAGADRDNKAVSSLLQKELSRSGDNSTTASLKKVWFNPKDAPKEGGAPIGLIMTGKRFDSGDDYLPDPWIGHLVRLFYRNGYCCLVVTCERGNWRNVVVRQVEAAVQSRPKSVVPVDTDRIVMVTDVTAGFVGMETINRIPSRIAGAVFVNAPPFVFRPNGQVIAWNPDKKAWKVPYWVTLGGNASDCGDLAVMWRRFFSGGPAGASTTLDQAPGKGLGYVIPSAGIEKWLKSIRDGKVPQKGVNRQLAAEKKRYGITVEKLKGRVLASSVAGSGAETQKNEAGVLVSVSVPRGWQRTGDIERPYLSKTSLDGSTGKNPFVELHMATIPRSSMVGYVFMAPGINRVDGLLNFCRRRIELREYLPFDLATWTERQWTFRTTSVMHEYKGRWERWFVLYAVKPAGAGKKGSVLLMIMDKSSKPDVSRMASSMRELIETVKVETASGGGSDD